MVSAWVVKGCGVRCALRHTAAGGRAAEGSGGGEGAGEHLDEGGAEVDWAKNLIAASSQNFSAAAQSTPAPSFTSAPPQCGLHSPFSWDPAPPAHRGWCQVPKRTIPCYAYAATQMVQHCRQQPEGESLARYDAV